MKDYAARIVGESGVDQPLGRQAAGHR